MKARYTPIERYIKDSRTLNALTKKHIGSMEQLKKVYDLIKFKDLNGISEKCVGVMEESLEEFKNEKEPVIIKDYDRSIVDLILSVPLSPENRVLMLNSIENL